MSEVMMPISADAIHYRALLFNLSEPVTMAPNIFDEAWPYVDSVYTKLRSEPMVQYALGHMSAGKVIKRRCSSIRDPGLCEVHIKVSRLVDGSVTIERLDEHTHTHDIEESFRVKKPSIPLRQPKFIVHLKYFMHYIVLEQLKVQGG